MLRQVYEERKKLNVGPTGSKTVELINRNRVIAEIPNNYLGSVFMLEDIKSSQ